MFDQSNNTRSVNAALASVEQFLRDALGFTSDETVLEIMDQQLLSLWAIQDIEVRKGILSAAFETVHGVILTFDKE